MPKAINHPADLSVAVSRNGHVLIFQGLHHQGLLILREHVPRFLENPLQAAMLVMPPFAATALSCYTALEENTSIEVTRDRSLGTEFSMVITMTRGSKIAYYSDFETSIGPRALAKQGIVVAITPMAVVAVDQSGASPSLSPVASIPRPQTPDYSMRFAAAPGLIKEAVQDALYKTNTTLRYAN